MDWSAILGIIAWQLGFFFFQKLPTPPNVSVIYMTLMCKHDTALHITTYSYLNYYYCSLIVSLVMPRLVRVMYWLKMGLQQAASSFSGK